MRFKQSVLDKCFSILTRTTLVGLTLMMDGKHCCNSVSAYEIHEVSHPYSRPTRSVSTSHDVAVSKFGYQFSVKSFGC